MLHAIRESDLIFSWFASHHSFLPSVLGRRLGKKVAVNAVDYDLADENWETLDRLKLRVRRVLVNRIMNSAHVVMVPSRFSESLALQNTVLKHIPERIKVIPLGFALPPVINVPREKIFTTVGDLDKSNWIRKGHREFVGLAAHFSSTPFFLVGKPRNEDFLAKVRSESSQNLSVTGYLNDDELVRLMARTQVYVQLSLREGFGCSLAEAMSLGCVPVVTREGSLPEVVGDCGYYVQYGDKEAARTAFKRALDDDKLGARARERVRDCFSLDRRRKAIYSTLEQL